MKRLLMLGGLVLALAAFAAPSAVGQSDDATKACKAERTAMGAETFAATYGKNKSKSNAFGKCVSSKSKALGTDEVDSAAEAAAEKECLDERGRMGLTAFKDKYGTNKNKANAVGKCVSGKMKAAKAKDSAAKKCKAERTSMGLDAFKTAYGTGKGKSNAFGKCVSAQSKKEN